MKKTLIVATVLSFAFGVQAQTLEDGIKMLQYERYQSAKKILEPLAASNPKANYYLGLATLATEDVNGAKAIFSKYPEDPANIAGMARVSFEEKNQADGLQKAQLAASKAKKKDWEPFKYAGDAVNYAESGNTPVAIDYYKKALEKSPDNADVRIALGDAYVKMQGGGGEAMNNYEAVVAKNPKNSLAYFRIGSLWYAAKQYQQALDNYQKAKDTDPTNPLPYDALANAYFYVGKYELALENSNKYLELSDKSAEDRFRHINILYLGKHYKEVIEKVQELINEGVVKPYIYRLMGNSLLETGDYANARSYMQTFFVKQPANKVLPQDYLAYGRIMLKLQQSDSADVNFTKAIELDTAKDKSDIYREIADGFKELKGDTAWKRAGEWYYRIVKQNPDTKVMDYFNAGVYSYYGKSYSDAATIFAAMRAKHPDQPSAIYWQGRVAAAQDNEAKTGAALQYYNEWLAISDSNYVKKPADLIKAYQYMALYYYNKGEKTQAQTYMDKITALDPADPLVKQLQDAMNPKKATAPAKAKTPAKAK